MSIRIWKIAFSAIFSFLIFAYAVQNVANITDGMFGSFAYVLGQADHLAYPESVVPVIAHPVLIWAVLLIVLASEFLCGILAAIGAWNMWQHRTGTSAEFRAAKTHAINAFGLGVVIWLLFFGTFGGAVFQMWQTEIGTSSFNGAFQLTVYSLLLFGLVSLED